jgi:hypothetical protein
MKKVMSLLVAATAVFAVSCGGSGGSKSPADIEKSIYSQFQSGNYQKGLEIYFANIDKGDNEQTAEAKEKEAAYIKALAEKVKADQKNQITKFEILEETIAEDGETATVKVKFTTGDGKESEQTSKYVKKDGQWKIVYSK